MFLINWLYSALNALGLANKDAKIIFLGLDNAGKTTLLHMLRDDKVEVHEPTRHAQSEDLVIGNIKFRTFDLGGHQAARRLWTDYFVKVDGVVFLVDAADPDRFEESKEQLNLLLTDEELLKTPFLILGNKVDKKAAINEPDFRDYMGLKNTTGKNNISTTSSVRPIEVFMCSVVKKWGYSDGFRWLSNFIE